MIPLPNNYADLDAVREYPINSSWHAGGVAKPRYYSQDCSGPLDNDYYGADYTSYVTEEYFESHRDAYPTCDASNAYICCSPEFPTD